MAAPSGERGALILATEGSNSLLAAGRCLHAAGLALWGEMRERPIEKESSCELLTTPLSHLTAEGPTDSWQAGS